MPRGGRKGNVKTQQDGWGGTRLLVFRKTMQWAVSHQLSAISRQESRVPAAHKRSLIAEG